MHFGQRIQREFPFNLWRSYNSCMKKEFNKLYVANLRKNCDLSCFPDVDQIVWRPISRQTLLHQILIHDYFSSLKLFMVNQFDFYPKNYYRWLETTDAIMRCNWEQLFFSEMFTKLFTFWNSWVWFSVVILLLNNSLNILIIRHSNTFCAGYIKINFSRITELI